MRKIILSFGSLLCVFISMAQVSDNDKNAALQLVNANRTTLGLSADDLNSLIVSGSYQDNSTGIRYVYLQQTFMDIPVYNQIQVISFRNNKVLSNAGGRIANIAQKINVASGIPNMSAAPAVMAAIWDRRLTTNQPAVAITSKDNGRFIEFDDMGISLENITARLMWYPSADSTLVSLAWQVYIIPTTSSDYWLVRIDAENGNTLGADNLTVYCSWDDPHKNDFNFGINSNNNNQLNNGTCDHQLFDLKKIAELSDKSPRVPILADNAAYRVIPLPYEAPSFMPGPSTTWHQLVTNPWTATGVLPNAVTLKWQSTDITGTDYNYTRGNNTWAYQDIFNTNTGSVATSASSTTGLPNLNFDFTPDYTLGPTLTSPPNQQFNITNLFYWNNIIHDVMYAYGFDEVSGNFQVNNLGRGGIGNDHVNAEAQDGSGTNNANFATPPDGSQPRMQMYLFNTSTPFRDGDVDNGVIAHEFGHGISNRLTGGPAITTCLQNAEQMGEGWSDYQSLMFTQDWVNSNLNTGFTNPRGIGTYVLNQATNGLGIRSQKYCTDFTINNKVYAASIPSTPHDRGEIWCAVLWDMTWNIIQQNGTINPNIYDLAGGGGNTIAWKLVIEGMKLQPCSPGFIDGRNAILQADLNLYGGTYQCAIKEAFRRRGMGDGASQGSSGSVNDQIPSFVLNGGAAILTLLQNGVTSTPEGQNIDYINRVVTGNCGAITNYKLTDTLPTNVSFVSANNGGTYNPGNRVVSWTINQGTGTTVDYLFSVNVNAGTYYAPVTILDEMVAGPPPTIPANWTTTAAPTNNLWISSNAQSHSTPNSFFTSNLATANDQILVNTNSLALTSPSPKLSFWGFMNSQANRDGGVVEISINGGGTWSDLGAQMISGGYNATLNTSSNPLSGRPAFTGNSSGFVKTTINLAPYSCQANIKFRFRFGSDESANAIGWYVDDILIQDSARVEMRSSLFNVSLVRQQVSDSIMSITASPGCTPPTVTCHPANFNACAASNSSFSVGAVGTSPLTYQWQESTTGAGGPWNNIIDGGVYGGATTATLTLIGVTLSMTDYQYRCIVTGQCAPSVTSNAAILSVNLSVSAGTISGASPLCIGDTTTYQSNGTASGTWSSSNIAVATIDINTGLVTAVGSGTTIITYTVINGCLGPINAIKILTVSTNVLGGAVSGSSPLCIGATSTYSSSGTITFSGSLETGDQVLPSGRIYRDGNVSNCAFTKICPGTISGSGFWYDTYSYTNPLSTAACITITFTNTSPSALQVASAYLGSFSPAFICTNYLADFGASPNPGSSATFSFMLPGSATAVLMVSTVDVGIGGSYSMLVDGPVTATGGVWSSSDMLVATVNSSTGLVSAVGAGTTNITYTINTGSGCPVSIFKTLTVNPNVTAGTVSGVSPLVCIGAAVIFSSNGDAGGIWSSTNTAVATVNPLTGLVTAVSAGTTDIIYTVNSGCGSPVSSFKTVTVIPGATAGTVSGSSPLCIGATNTYTSTGIAGGTWSSSIPGVATVNSVTGLVTAVSAGNTNITYTVSSGCSSPISSFQALTVSPNISAGSVSGSSTLCIGYTSTYTSSGAGGGSWSSSNSSVATVNSSTGMVTAISAGTTNIIYTINSGCGSPVSSFQALTVNLIPTVNPVANVTICNKSVSDSVIFSGNAGTTYSWTNSNPSIGLAANGAGNIAGFTATNTSNVPVVATITVTPLSGPGNISYNFNGSLQNWTSALAGTTCLGYNYSNNTWGLQTNAFEGSNSIGVPTTVNEHSYIMSPLLSFGNGAKTISFKSFSNNESGYPCTWDVELIEISTDGGASWTTINGGSVPYLNDVYNDAQWRTITLTTTTPATANGRLRFRYDTGNDCCGGSGINNGWYIDNVSISNTSICTGPPITFTITVNPNASAGIVSGISSLCMGATATYSSNGDPGGSWSSSNTAVATVNSVTGVVTALGTGTTDITYRVTDSGQPCPKLSFKTLTVNQETTVNQPANQTVCNNGITAPVNFTGTPFAEAIYTVSPYTNKLYRVPAGAGNYTATSEKTVSMTGFTVYGLNYITVDPSSGLYYVIVNVAGSYAPSRLGVIDTATGIITDKGSLGDPFSSLTFSPNGKLWGVTAGYVASCSGCLYTINKTNATKTYLRTLGNGEYSQVICFRPDDGYIYHWGGYSTVIYEKLDTTSYNITPIGTYSTSIGSGEVYGATIDPVTGNFTIVDVYSNVESWNTLGPVSSLGVIKDASSNYLTARGLAFGNNLLFNWTNNTPSIGLAASGTGNIASFTASNSGTTPVTATITVTSNYTKGGITCSGVSKSFTITVNPNADAGTISGVSPLCIGATNNYTSNGNPGGTWISSNTLVATVNSSTGLVTAVSAGTTNITYTASLCPSFPKTLTVNPNVISGTVSGPSSICNGETISFTCNGTPGGTWSSSNSSVATVNSSTGMVTAISAGTTNIIYTINSGCGSPVSSFQALTVNLIPTVNPVANVTICNKSVSDSVIFSGNAGTTYSWTNSNPSIGLAANGAGNIAGFTATNTSNVPVVATITVTPLSGPGNISYNFNGSLQNWTSALAGTTCLGYNYSNNTWGLQTNAFEGSNSIGVPTTVNEHSYIMSPLLSFGNGAKTISFKSFSNNESGYPCTWDVELIEISTDGGASWTTINGGSVPYLNDVYNDAQWRTITLTTTTPATANGRLRFRYDTGNDCCGGSGINNGWYIDNVSISNTSICTGPPITFTITVNPNASAGTVSGSSPLCIGTTATYSSNGDPGGSWSSSNTAVATVNSVTGVVTALSAGTTDITYRVTDSGQPCPKLSFKTLTVNQETTVNQPANQTVCNNGITTPVNFTGTPFLGAIYTVSPYTNKLYRVPAGAGNYTATSEKTVSMTGFTVYGLNYITVDPSSGLYYVIVNVAGSYAPSRLGVIDTATGIITDKGSLGDPFSSLTFSPNGKLWGVTGYGASCSGCLYTINKTNATKTYLRTLGYGGYNDVICFRPDDGYIYHWWGYYTVIYEKLDTTSYNITPIGTYSTSIGSGEVYGATIDPVTGNFTIVDVYSNVESWNTLGPVSSLGVIKDASSYYLTARGLAFGNNLLFNWTNNTPSIGLAASGTGNIASFTASNSGTTPVTATITVTSNYTQGGITCSGVSKSFTITVNPNADAGTISGVSPLCIGATNNYTSNGNPGGTWISSNTLVATVNSLSGLVTALSAGTTNITYTASQCPSFPKTLTVNPNVISGTVSGPSSICNGETISFTCNGTPGGTWSSSNSSVATVNSSTGMVTAISAGTTNIIYTINSGCGSPVSSFQALTVNLIPTVNPVANVTICNKSVSDSVIFSGSLAGTTYSWTNSNPSIGLASSGAGNIAGFTATNTSNVPVVATITVTPLSGPGNISYNFNGSLQNWTSALAGTTCLGYNYSNNTWGLQTNAFEGSNSIGVPTTVNEHSYIMSPLLSFGNGAKTISFKSFSNNESGYPCTWDVELIEISTDGGASWTTINGGSVPYLNDVYNDAQWRTITLTTTTPATANGRLRFRYDTGNDCCGGSGINNGWYIDNVSISNTSICTGPPITFTITVNPNASAGTVSGSSPLCIGTTATYSSNGDPGGSWSSSNTAVATVNSVTGVVTALSAGTTDITYRVTDSGQPCPKLSFKTLTVNQETTVNQPANQTVCNNGITTPVNFTGTPFLGAIYTVSPYTNKLYRVPAGAGNYTATSEKTVSMTGFTVYGLNYITVDPSSGLYYVIVNVAGSYAPSRLGVIDTATGIITDKGSLGDPFSSLTFSPNGKLWGVTGYGASCSGCLYTINKTNATKTYLRTLGYGGYNDVICFRPDDGYIYHWWGYYTVIYEKLDTTSYNITPIGTYSTSIGSGEVYGATIDPVTGNFTIVDVYSNVESWNTLGPVSSLGVIKDASSNYLTARGLAFGNNLLFNWTNNTPSIGLAASGTGNIASFTASNSGTTPVTATITVTSNYTQGGITCSGVSKSFTITVNPNADAGTISGVSPLCIGATNNYTSNGNPGGTWISSNTLVATVNSLSGLVTALSAGTTNITYTASQCPSFPKTLTVNPNVISGTVSGPSSICNGETISFTCNGTPGGTWSSSNSSVATVNSSTGMVTAISAGTTNIIYTINSGCGSPVSSFQALTVNLIPTVNPVANVTICNKSVSDSVIFSGSLAGTTYSWTNSNPSIGLASSGAGNIAGFTATNTSNVPVVATITVTPLSGPGNISYNFNGSLQNWTSALAGTTCYGYSFSTNTWGLQTNAFEGTNSIGVTTVGGEHSYIMSPLLSFGNGAKTISFKSFSNNQSGYPCTWDVELIEISTDGGASWTTINGGSVPYLNDVYNDAQWRTITLTTTTPATANGRLRFRYDTGDGCCGGSGINNGWYIDNVSISNTSICTGPPITFTITVNPNASAGTVSGSSPLCIGTTATYSSNGDPGGSWSSSNTAVATVNSVTGVVTALSAGTTDITYRVTDSGQPCPKLSFKTLTVNQETTVNQPANQTVCNNGITTPVNFTGTPFLGAIYTVSPYTNKLYRVPAGAGNYTATSEKTVSMTGFTVYGLNYITVDPSSGLYYVIVNVAGSYAPSRLGVIDTATGIITDKGSLGDPFSSLTFSPNGKLWGVTGYGASCSGCLYTINKTNATKTYLRTLGNSASGDVICFRPDDGYIYHWWGYYTVIYEKLDTTSYNITPIGTYSTSIGSGEVYGATIDPVTGNFTIVDVYSNVESWNTLGPVSSLGVIKDASSYYLTARGLAFGNNLLFNWTNNTPSIGLAASGTGNIASFTASNSGTTPVTATITVTSNYTQGGITCSGTSKSFTITVNPNADAGTISGVSPLCIGATNNYTSNGNPGGAWISSNTSVAIVNLSTGLVIAVSEGTTNITYTASLCPSFPKTLTVNPNVISGIVSGPSSVCNGEIISFTYNGTPGGNWSSSNSSVATVNSLTGVVTSISAGTTNIIYTINSGCGSPVSSFQALTVNLIPTVNPVANVTICNKSVSDSVIFSGSLAGTTYSWTNNNSSIGLAASGTGNIAGFTATNTSNVPVVATITVTPLSGPGNISYNFNGSLQNWTSALAGTTCLGFNYSSNTWGLQTNAFEGTNSIGVTTTSGEHSYIMSPLLSFGNGAKTISFKSFSNNESGYPCTWDVELIEISTDGGASWTTINGGSVPNLNNVYNDAQWRTITLTTTTPATANGRLRFRYDTGNDCCGGTGINNGWYIDDLTISNTNICTGTPITFTITVNPNASAGTVSGSSPLCIGTTATYSSNGDPGGSWSSSNTAVATVNLVTGLVTAVSAGTTDITYKVMDSGQPCPKLSSKTLMVNQTPTVNQPANQTVCNSGVTAPVNFTVTPTSEIFNWTNDTPSIGLAASGTGSIASFNAINSGITPVTATITVTPAYINGGVTCAGTPKSFTITVTPGATPGTVSGVSPLCIGATVTYTSTGDSGGTWTSSNTSVATVNSTSGLVTAVSAGTTNITYTIISGCLGPINAFKTLTVSPNISAGTVSGSSPLCIGAITIYSSSGTTGGSWSSTNTAVATVNPSSGVVTAVSVGTTNITFTVNSGCNSASSFKTLTVSVSLTPGTISGTSPLCIGAIATYSSNGDAGGFWSSTNTAVATVASSSGVVTALSAGTTNITYTLGGCGTLSAFKTLTVSSNVNAGTVSGVSPLCIGATATYSSSGTSGGSWSSTNTAVATVNSSSGEVTAVSAGITNITYTLIGCGNLTAFKTLTVNPVSVSAGTVSGISPLCALATAAYTSNGTIGGNWSSSNNSVATVNSSSGVVTAVNAGTTNITYTVSGCGLTVSAFKTLTVNPLPVVILTGPTTVCYNSSNIYTTQAGMSNYVWNVTGGTITAGGTASQNTATITWNGSYPFIVSVNYTNSNGCTALTTTSLDITVNPLPEITLSGPNQVCPNSTENVYTTEADMTNYIWNVVNGSITSGGGSSDNTATVTWGPSGPFSISVNYANGNGCTAAVPFVLNVSTFCLTDFIRGSVRKNADPTKIDIVFKPTYTSVVGEYINFLQFSLAIPVGLSAGVIATAVGVNTFSNMGTLFQDIEYTQGTERIFTWIFAVPSGVTQSWTNGVDFKGIEVTFSTTAAAAVGKMVDFSNNGGGDNANTYFTISSSTGDKTDYPSLFHAISGQSALGTYPSGDQFVYTTNDNAPGAILLIVGDGCSDSPYTNADATQSGSEPFAACQGTAGYKTVWYKFTAPASGAVKISNDYSGGTMGSDSRLALFSATDVSNYATFTNIACDDDNGSTAADRSVLYATGLTPGNTYYIQVDGKDGSTAAGTFCLTVDELTSAMISTSTACAAGQNLTLVNDNYIGYLSVTDASSKLVALIENPSGGATTSTYTNSLNINTGTVRADAVSGQRYLDRNFSINNSTVSNVNVQFFILNTELAALQAADPDVTLANLQVTKQTGTNCDNNFIAANGTNSSLPQTGNGSGPGYCWVQVNTPGFPKFFLHTNKSYLPVKTFLQGAYNTGLARHRNNTAAWVGALNAGTGGNALSQPYSAAPFNYTGTESVPSGYFKASANPTAPMDWVLLELRDATTPATVIARRAALIRVDGRIVDLDSTSYVTFNNVPTGTYHLVIRHRNHLAIRTATVRALDGTMGVAAPALYDFSTGQAQAFQDETITTNAAMKDLGGGVFAMWGGNANGMTSTTGAATTTRVSSGSTINDYLFLINTTLGGNVSLILSNRYHPADMNMDGTVRASSGGTINDYLFLVNTALGGNLSTIITQHQ